MKLDTILIREELSREEIVFLLSLKDPKQIDKLFLRADEIRKTYCGDEVHLRGIIEISNCCEQDCLYCGIRKSNVNLERYRITVEEILETAGKINGTGIRTIVLQSGEDHFYSKEIISKLIVNIKNNFDTAITLSLGERGRDEYDEWKKVGADRYLLKHETANERLYSTYHQQEKLKSRLAHITYLKSIGFQTGSGNIIGLPEQSLEDITDDILLCKKLDCDMCSFSPFIPSSNTPLKNVPAASLELTLQTIAVARIVLKNAHIPATTALSTLAQNGSELGLRVGANVIMPNFTPAEYRDKYLIYENKNRIDYNIDLVLADIKNIVQKSGRKISQGKGHSIKQFFSPV